MIFLRSSFRIYFSPPFIFFTNNFSQSESNQGVWNSLLMVFLGICLSHNLSTAVRKRGQDLCGLCIPICDSQSILLISKLRALQFVCKIILLARALGLKPLGQARGDRVSCIQLSSQL